MADRQHDVETRQRRTVHFSGRVQGVGFRYTTCNVAEGFAVTGYVQNLPDGRVKLVAEGAMEELDRFVNRVGEVLGRYIEHADTTDAPATGEYAAFTVER